MAIGAAMMAAAGAAPAQAEPAYALSTTNQLLVFDTRSPGTITATVTITGLPPGEGIRAIDVRPATGQLYGLGSMQHVYVIDPATGAARPVGTDSFQPSLLGSSYGFDFNPVVDRIRVVSNEEQNFRLNPDTGAGAAVDANLATTGEIVAAAYTNNYSGATSTTLYGIDQQNQQLVLQGGLNGSPSPNGGAITPVGSLALGANGGSLEVGFDISPTSGVAYATFSLLAGGFGLFTIDLATGAATLVGEIGTTDPQIMGLALASRPTTLYGVTTSNELVRFHSATPGILRTGPQPITGLEAGENILGIDFRPSNGQLYALGSSRRLYRIDTATAAATAVALPFGAALAGTDIGFDFNPVADRIRVVTSAGENFRLHPDTGARLSDTALTESSAPDTAIAAAYTNNVDGATATTLYTIDATTDRLQRQGSIGGSPVSPNAGVVFDVGPLGVDASAVTGFDITPGDDTAFAALTVGGVPTLYLVDLQTGAATLVGAIGAAAPLRALAAQATSYYLTEGATGTFFDTDLVIFNPNQTATPATITYLRDDGRTFTQGVNLAARAFTTVLADQAPGLEFTAFSSVVSSPLGLPLAVERTMRWDPSGYGSHTDKAAGALSRTWYFAEGSQGFFHTFLLLSNPSNAPNSVRVEFLLEGGGTVVRTYPMIAWERLTISAAQIPELVDRSFGISVAFDRAGGAERAMYFGTPTFNGGHESAGVPSPAASWFLAEGATGDFFSTFLLIANPGDSTATLTITYFPEGGAPIVTNRVLAARARLTINLINEDPSLAATAVATQVVSSGSPVVVERAQYWAGPLTEAREAHNSFGVTSTALRWALAEGRTGGPLAYATYILLANPGSQPAEVTLTFVRTGNAPVTRTVTVPANSRFTVTTGPGSQAPELLNESFSTLISSTQPIFAERAMYSNDANGAVWAAGSNATATAVP